MRSLALLFAALLLSACSQTNEKSPSDAGVTTPSPVASVAATEPAPVAPAVARKVSEANDDYVFDYAYPAAAAAIPALKAWLDSDIDKQKAELASEAKGQKAEAAKNDYPFRPYSRGLDWQVVTEMPGWLSLSSMISADTGGAHPNYWFDAILWDKAANKRRDPKTLFTSKEDLAKAVQPEFCRQIDRQRAKKRGDPVKREIDDPFNKCLDPTDYVVILGSSTGNAFDRIGVLVPPYEAGPYVEGFYEVTMPVTPAILAAVKPEFKSSFAIAR